MVTCWGGGRGVVSFVGLGRGGRGEKGEEEGGGTVDDQAVRPPRRSETMA